MHYSNTIYSPYKITKYLTPYCVPIKPIHIFQNNLFLNICILDRLQGFQTNRTGRCGRDFSGAGHREVAGCHDDGNEMYSYIKCRLIP